MSFPIEGNPTPQQKERLEGWLSELKLICSKYQLLLDTEDDQLSIVDLDSQRIIGIGVTYLFEVRAGRTVITGYDATDSILDGVWLIDTPAGPIEQRLLPKDRP